MKRNAIERSEYIKERYKEYLRSFFKLSSKEMQEKFKDQLNCEDLFKGPYVELNLLYSLFLL